MFAVINAHGMLFDFGFCSLMFESLNYQTLLFFFFTIKKLGFEGFRPWEYQKTSPNTPNLLVHIAELTLVGKIFLKKKYM